MYMEVKSIFSVVSMIFIGIVLSQIIFLNLVFGVLLFMSIFFIILGDLILGIRITPFRPIFEPTPPGKELTECQLIDGTVLFINTTKAPLGKREFVVHKKEASVINDGKGRFRLVNGNIGFRSHERFDRSIDPKRCKYLEYMPVDNIQELYKYAKEKDKVDGWLKGLKNGHAKKSNV